MNTEQLNKKFAIESELEIIDGSNDQGNFPFINIINQHAKASISLYGGQVLSYQPQGNQTDLLFLSDKAYYEKGKAIKGGIPVCWPWFGNDPENKGRAAHGFVRNRFWSIVATSTSPHGETIIELGLDDSAETLSIWPHTFALRLLITIGQSLKLELITQNTGDEAFSITQALHTYLVVADIGKTKIQGLKSIEYIDKTIKENNQIEKETRDSIGIDQEVDRIYVNAPAELQLKDSTLNRTVSITSRGSKTAVVWNPWINITKGMADLNDNDYQHFVCIETANAASDIITIQPGENFRLQASYCIYEA